MVAVGGPEGRLCLAVTFVCACIGSSICLHCVGGTIAWRRHLWGKLLSVFLTSFPLCFCLGFFFLLLVIFVHIFIYLFICLLIFSSTKPSGSNVTGACRGLAWGARGWVAGWAGQSGVLVPWVWLQLQTLGPLSTWPPFATWVLTYWKFAF